MKKRFAYWKIMWNFGKVPSNLLKLFQSLWIVCAFVIVFCFSAQAAEWNLLFDAAQSDMGFRGWVNQFVFHTSKPNVLYAATEGAGVLVSEDGGSTWVPKNQGLTEASEGTVSGYHARCLVIDPTKPGFMYVGMAAFGVFKSTDNGANWTDMNNMLGDTFTKVMAIHPAKPDTLYLGTDGGGIYRRSTSDSAEWVEISEGLKNTYIRAMVMDPKDPKIIYAGSDAGVSKTTNGGDLWATINNGLTSRYILTLAIDPKNPKVLYAGTDGGGLFKSEDGGDSWASFGGDIWMAKSVADEFAPPGEALIVPVVSSIAVNPVNTAIVYAANSEGVFRSTDFGKNWAKIDAGLTSKEIKSLAASPASPVKVYASTADGKLFVYTEE